MDVREKLMKLLCDGTAKTETCDLHKDCVTAKGDCGFCTIMADHLLANGVTVQSNELLTNCNQLWIPASVPPTEYRDEYGELIPFLVCLDGTEYPFRAMYDGKVWGDGWAVIPVKFWMHLPEPPKEGS